MLLLYHSSTFQTSTAVGSSAVARAQRHAREMGRFLEVGVPRLWSQQARQYVGVDFCLDAIEFSARLPAPSLKIGRQHQCFSLRQVSADGGGTSIGS